MLIKISKYSDIYFLDVKISICVTKTEILKKKIVLGTDYASFKQN